MGQDDAPLTITKVAGVLDDYKETISLYISAADMNAATEKAADLGIPVSMVMAILVSRFVRGEIPPIQGAGQNGPKTHKRKTSVRIPETSWYDYFGYLYPEAEDVHFRNETVRDLLTAWARGEIDVKIEIS